MRSAKDLSHAEFVEMLRRPGIVGGVRSLVVASVEAWGVSGVVALIFASAVVSAPMLVMAATAVRYGHLGALPFVAVGLLPAYSGRPNLNCIELTWWLTAGLLSVGAAVVNWLSGGSDETFAFLTLAAMVPAPTYLLAGAARAYLIFSLVPEICADKALYDRLAKRDQLLVARG